jgi:hypothetical protein
MREGRRVLVIGGEYRGLTGKIRCMIGPGDISFLRTLLSLLVFVLVQGIIDSCIPGGWYLVKDLFRNNVLNVVLSMRDLALIPENIVTNTPDEGQQELMNSMKTR